MSQTTEVPSVKTSIFGAYSNFLNSIVGAGIIGMPYALRHCGLVMGLFLLLFVSFLTDHSVRLMVSIGTDLDCRDYEALAKRIFGPRGYTFVSLAMLILAWGAMIAYCVIIGDVVPSILGVEEPTYGQRAASMVVCSFTVM